MNSYYFLFYHPFDMWSTIEIVDDYGKHFYKVDNEIGTLCTSLVSYAYQHNSYNINIVAPDLISAVIRDAILETEQQTYSTNKIRVITV